MEIGEGYVGSGPNAAHINTILGSRDGPVGAAFAAGLAGPSAGHAAFVVVGQPGVMTLPATLFVNKAAIAGDEHAKMTWGPAQAGVAKGVAEALRSGAIKAEAAHDLALIAAVWVDPAADDAGVVFANNAQATYEALRNGQRHRPEVTESIAAGLLPWNPFFKPAG